MTNYFLPYTSIIDTSMHWGFRKGKNLHKYLTNFRQSLVENEVTTGTDLLKAEVDALSANLIELDKNMARRDSFLLSSSC